MSIDIVFNELSVVPAAEDAYSAQARMTTFVAALSRARRENVAGVLRVPVNFYTIPLAPDYLLYQWSNDRQVDRDARLFLKTLATKSPFLADSPKAADKALVHSFTVDGEMAEGCGSAYLLDAISVSLESAPRWNTSILAVAIEYLNEANTIEIGSAEVIHASRASHVLEHREWIKKRLSQSINSGEEMWSRKEELFPSLLFCEQVERQMRTLEHGTSMLQPVIKHLFALEAYCKVWAQGAFDPTQISANVSPESSATLGQYHAERTFRCPDGVDRVFSWHLKINSPAWRIYFDFDNGQPSTLLIGYIGKHLPTVSDPT